MDKKMARTYLLAGSLALLMLAGPNTNLLAQPSTDNNLQSSFYIAADTYLSPAHFHQKDAKISNGSGLAPDIYFINKGGRPHAIGGEAGYIFSFNGNWLSSIILGLEYSYTFSLKAIGVIRQFSNPQFDNYSYSYHFHSNELLFGTHIGIARYKRLTLIGYEAIGFSNNRISRYSESAYPGINQRVAPGFSNQSTVQFAYNLGGGLLYHASQHISLEANYIYKNYGVIKSGVGLGTFNGSRIRAHASSNGFIVNLQYMFNPKG